jgi:Uma2 family endonuclease
MGKKGATREAHARSDSKSVSTRKSKPWTAACEIARRRFTVDEYYRMAEVGILTEDDRVELLDGEIVEMSPIGDRHAWCVDELTEMLVPLLKGRARVRVQNPVHLDAYSEPQPDLALLRRRKGRAARKHPRPEDTLLVIDVGDSTVERDRLLKLPLYAQSGIPEAWIVDLPGDFIEIQRDPAPSGYRGKTIHRRGETVSPIAFPAVKIPVDKILPKP